MAIPSSRNYGTNSNSLSDCEHEACVYYRLRDLWTTVVPDFLGFGQLGFFHILLLSDLGVSLPAFLPVLVS